MRLRIPLVAALALLAVAGCNDQPLFPEPGAADQLAATFAHAGTSFTGTATIECPPGSIPGTEKTLPTGQVLQMNRHVYYYFDTSETRLTGMSEWWTNKKIEADKSATKIWGKLELVVDGGLGVWEVSFHGYRIGPWVELEATGQGKEGAVKGLVTKFTMGMPAKPPCLPPPNGTTPGRILNVAGEILDK
jgi:hypothetical protein